MYWTYKPTAAFASQGVSAWLGGAVGKDPYREHLACGLPVSEVTGEEESANNTPQAVHFTPRAELETECGSLTATSF